MFPVVLAVSLISFGLQAIAPGDPARMLIEASGISPAPPEAVAAKRRQLGLDRPWPERYLRWLGNAARGDLGRSYRTYEPVARLYLQRLPATAILALVSFALSATISVPLGLSAAYRRGGLLDVVASAVAVAGTALPSFWLAFLLMFVFAARLQWFPVLGSVSLRGVVLPAVVLALPAIAIQTRLIRASALDVLSQDFVVVARAKGLSGRAVARRHVLPNAALPAMTVFGMEMAALFSGAAVIEYVFAWPGVGKLAIDAVLLRDTPVVVGFAMVAAAALVFANLAVDLIVGMIDPRVRR